MKRIAVIAIFIFAVITLSGSSAMANHKPAHKASMRTFKSVKNIKKNREMREELPGLSKSLQFVDNQIANARTLDELKSSVKRVLKKQMRMIYKLEKKK
jgi:hypothetical protein